ncbi:hypothetical protein RUM44_000003 [Polyplax serrata]|uniref:Uncharacterized protein n=1 Tax=Polyplax serrata TaxID=468196 RepID=A0ABR1B497_POLSC
MSSIEIFSTSQSESDYEPDEEVNKSASDFVTRSLRNMSRPRRPRGRPRLQENALSEEELARCAKRCGFGVSGRRKSPHVGEHLRRQLEESQAVCLIYKAEMEELRGFKARYEEVAGKELRSWIKKTPKEAPRAKKPSKEASRAKKSRDEKSTREKEKTRTASASASKPGKATPVVDSMAKQTSTTPWTEVVKKDKTTQRTTLDACKTATVEKLKTMIQSSAFIVRKVACSSRNLKGTFVKSLKDAASVTATPI